MENTKSKFGLSSFWLKVFACLFMTLDHIGLLFVVPGGPEINTAYYILRSIGKIAFPIFVFLAVEGAYKSKNIKNYLLRLAVMALAMDAFGYIYGAMKNIDIANNGLIGNVFTDLFMGVLAIYFLRKKNLYSLFVLFPIAFEFLSHLVISPTYGTLVKADWGSFSIVLFVAFFIARELADYFGKRKAISDGFDPDTYLNYEGLKARKIASVIALVSVDLIYYLIWRLNYMSPVLPNGFVPYGTFCALAGIFIALYNGERGYDPKWVKYGFYFYYPFHLILLGIISMFCGVLAM